MISVSSTCRKKSFLTVDVMSSLMNALMLMLRNRELCDISIVLLSEFEKRHREAEKARDNVCAGRPLRPYPPDIIER